jgi:hypothetical protein
MSLLQLLDSEVDVSAQKPPQPAHLPQQDNGHIVPKTDPISPLFLGAVPCEHEAVDQLAGLLSAQRIFFALDVGQVPYPAQLMVLSFWWFQRPIETKLGVRLLGPDGEQLAALSDSVAVDGSPTFYCHRVRFADPGLGTITLPAFGTYRIEIWEGPAQVGAYPLVVTEATAKI